MKENMAAQRRRGRGRYARAGGLLLAFALVGLTTACSREPSEKELRKQATSPAAQARRAVEEKKMRALIKHLTAVEGLEHVLTRFSDSCGRPYDGSIFENHQSPNALRCDMRAVAYFGVRGDITDVLPRIRAARIQPWGPQEKGRDMPYAGGTVSYALDYHRHHGRYKDGSLMPAPTLEAPGLDIDWDRPDMPLPNLVEEPIACPPAGSGGIYERCSTTPKAPMSVAAARSRYGTLLTFSLGGYASSGDSYFTVPRRS